MKYIFGPVPSRRLGLSLGVDLIPAKTCTYDCLYCQVGRTTCQTTEQAEFVPVVEVQKELEEVLKEISLDTITLAGSGEPTLHSKIDQIISSIRELTDTRIALLTNGSLLWRADVRERILGVDIIMPTLSTVFEETFRAIHRPHQDVSLPLIIEGLKDLRMEYKGQLFLEVVFLSGINDSEKELQGLKEVLEEISPDKIQLNTVVRPPSDPRALSLDNERLENIKDFIGEKAEIIAHVPLRKTESKQYSRIEAVIEMAKRRPVSLVDISNTLNISIDETEGLIKGLVIKGHVREQEHQGERYYIAV